MTPLSRLNKSQLTELMEYLARKAEISRDRDLNWRLYVCILKISAAWRQAPHASAINFIFFWPWRRSKKRRENV